MPPAPHVRVPFRLGAAGVDTVEQDSAEDVGLCVAMCLGTPQGTRLIVPTYGVPDHLFSRDTPASAIAEAVAEWEPRAAADVDVALDSIDPSVRHVVVRWQDSGDTSWPT